MPPLTAAATVERSFSVNDPTVEFYHNLARQTSALILGLACGTGRVTIPTTNGVAIMTFSERLIFIVIVPFLILTFAVWSAGNSIMTCQRVDGQVHCTVTTTETEEEKDRALART